MVASAEMLAARRENNRPRSYTASVASSGLRVHHSGAMGGTIDMAKKQKQKTFQDALAYLRSHAFDVQSVAGVANRVQAYKHGCGVILDRGVDGGTVCMTRPGCMVGGEIALIVDHGYQKFLQGRHGEIPATADHLHALHRFTEELHEAAGTTSLYNESLGTVSDLYLYDRLKGREAAPLPSGH